MRNIILVLAASFLFSVAARASGPLAPEAFAGTYNLVKEKVGMICQETMIGSVVHSLSKNDEEYVQVDLGSWSFLAVNLGPSTYDDDLSKTVVNSYTTEDSLVSESTDLNKATGRTYVSKTVAKLKGDSLHVVSKTKYHFEGGDSLSANFDCEYKKAD